MLFSDSGSPLGWAEILQSRSWEGRNSGLYDGRGGRPYFIHPPTFGVADEQQQVDGDDKEKNEQGAVEEKNEQCAVEEKTPQCNNMGGKHVQWADLNGRAVLAYTPEDGLASPCPSSIAPSKPCLKV